MKEADLQASRLEAAELSQQLAQQAHQNKEVKAALRAKQKHLHDLQVRKLTQVLSAMTIILL